MKPAVQNILGQRVQTLVIDVQYAGEYGVAWDGRKDAAISVWSGVYICRLEAQPGIGSGESTLQVRKMMLVR